VVGCGLRVGFEGLAGGRLGGRGRSLFGSVGLEGARGAEGFGGHGMGLGMGDKEVRWLLLRGRKWGI